MREHDFNTIFSNNLNYYLNENDKFVSNDKIYQTIFNACPEFNLIELNNEKGLSEWID